MKVTITDPKQKEAPLEMKDLAPGTLFTLNTKRSGFYIGLIVKESGTGKENNVVRLNGDPVYTVSIEDSWYKNEPVTIIKAVELSIG